MSKKVAIAALAAVVLGIVIGYAIRYPFFERGGSKNDLPAETPPPAKPAYAVVIENAPVVQDPEREARPQLGLGKAEVVIETLAEGGITRYLAIFQNEQAPKIGPVRSLRPYFLEWAMGFGTPIAFSGGSTEALSLLEAQGAGARALNEFFNEDTFYRDKSRAAPHNLFTSSALLGDAVAAKGWGTLQFVRGWDVKPRGAVPAEPVIREIFVDFSFGLFEADYRYDEQTNSYLRSLGGKAHLDEAGTQLAVDNVVIIRTTSRLLDQKLLTLDIETFGSGQATIFRDGQVIQARWRKNSVSEPLRLIDADGTAVVLNEGKTWIAVVDQDGNVSWK